MVYWAKKQAILRDKSKRRQGRGPGSGTHWSFSWRACGASLRVAAQPAKSKRSRLPFTWA